MKKLKGKVSLAQIIVAITITIVFIAFISWVIPGNRNTSKEAPPELRNLINNTR